MYLNSTQYFSIIMNVFKLRGDVGHVPVYKIPFYESFGGTGETAGGLSDSIFSKIVLKSRKVGKWLHSSTLEWMVRLLLKYENEATTEGCQLQYKTTYVIHHQGYRKTFS